jgi:hypothetical protein
MTEARRAVEIHHLLQRAEHAIVEGHVSRRHVAQRRRDEHAAELRVLPHILAIRPADAEIEMIGIAVRGQRRARSRLSNPPPGL